MNVERIRALLANGFKPFTLHMSDGRKFTVPHPEFIAVGRNVVVVIGRNDRVDLLDPLHITAVQTVGGFKG
jgi:hypothetical protein